MSLHTQAIVFNGVPLVVLSALYLGMTAALAPMALREWRRATALELAFLSLFPVLGLLTALFAIVVLVDEEPFGGHVWFGLASILVAAFPPIAVLVRWRERRQLIDGWLKSRETDERVAFVDRELDSVAAVSNELGRARDAESVARALLAQVGSLLSVDLTVLALVDVDRGQERDLRPARRRQARHRRRRRRNDQGAAGLRRRRAGPAPGCGSRGGARARPRTLVGGARRCPGAGEAGREDRPQSPLGARSRCGA